MTDSEKDSIAVAILTLAVFVLIGSTIAFAPIEFIITVGAIIATVAVIWAFIRVTR